MNLIDRDSSIIEKLYSLFSNKLINKAYVSFKLVHPLNILHISSKSLLDNFLSYTFKGFSILHLNIISFSSFITIKLYSILSFSILYLLLNIFLVEVEVSLSFIFN